MKPGRANATNRETPAKMVSDPSSSKRRSPVRRFWFRLLALVLPFVVLFVLEVALRMAGYGYQTSFFLKIHDEDRSMLVENPKFGWRFFPPAVARSPQPLLLQPHKPAGTVRIFVFGESAAMGDPEPAYGFARQLQRILQAQHPTNQIEVVNVAMTAINSHVIREIARDCRWCEGDVWLIYAGNNEVIGPFGAGTVFGHQAPGLTVMRATTFLKSSRIGQLLSSMRGNSTQPQEWTGMEMFLEHQVRADDRRLKRVYQNFEANLGSIIELGRTAGAKIIATTVPVNLKDCPPFGSAHRAGLTVEELRQWEERFSQGKRAEADHQFADAIAAYEEAARIDPGFAELVFRRAWSKMAQGQDSAARADFLLARDLDTLRFRADTRLNEIVRLTASSKRIALVDGEQECAHRSATGLPGDDLFYDHVHLNFSGNYALAKVFAAQVEQELFGSSLPETLGESDVAHQLAYTDFDRRRVGEEMRLRLRQPPFSSQSNYQERDQRWRQMLTTAHSAPAEAIWEYRAALALAPEDWVLRDNFGRVLEAADDQEAAAEQWWQVVQLMPHEAEGYFHLGNIAYDKRSYAGAADLFRQTLSRNPGSAEAINGLGLALAAEGQTNEARRQFETALAFNPQFSPARVNFAVLLAGQGDLAGAISEYQSILRLETNNVAARINLAKLLAGQGKKDAAIQLYGEALELKPDNAVAQYDLANALAAQGHHAEALAHYSAAVEYQPDFPDARYNLAAELASVGKITEALPQFAECVRLRPKSVEAHFNYGVALAKVKRYHEAAQQFQETLKLQPSYAAAQSMLDRALQLSSDNPQLP